MCPTVARTPVVEGKAINMQLVSNVLQGLSIALSRSNDHIICKAKTVLVAQCRAGLVAPITEIVWMLSQRPIDCAAVNSW